MYGTKNNDVTYKDLWSLFGEDNGALSKTDVQEKDLEWFLPSRAEWACFGKTFEITGENYNTMFGLSDWSWSSSLFSKVSVWGASFSDGKIDFGTFDADCVRFCTTF